MAEHSPTPWRVVVNPLNGGLLIKDCCPGVSSTVGNMFSRANAEFVVEAVNERDRLRDLVRRVYLVVKDANEFATSMASKFPELGDRRAWREMESILREAREALWEGLQEGDGKC